MKKKTEITPETPFEEAVLAANNSGSELPTDFAQMVGRGKRVPENCIDLQPTPPVLVSSFVASVVDATTLPESHKTSLKQAFSEALAPADALISEAATVVVKDAADLETMNNAKRLYDQLFAVSKAVNESHKTAKAHALAEGRAIDSIKNNALEKIAPALEHLKLQKDYLKLKAAADKAARHTARLTEISQLIGYFDQYADFGAMSEEQYNSVFQIAQNAKFAADEVKRLAAVKAEEDRLEMIRLKEAEQQAAKDRAAAAQRERDAAAAAAAAAKAETINQIQSGEIKIEMPAPQKTDTVDPAPPTTQTPPPPPTPPQTPNPFTLPAAALTDADKIGTFVKNIRDTTIPQLQNPQNSQILAHAVGGIENILVWLESQKY
jgi:hypothetical protein